MIAGGDVARWLLAGDPAIRWQVMRDLFDEPHAIYQAEQDRVATHGWGARLLACADDTGRWTPRIYGKKWISTTYSIQLLTFLGLPPGELRALRSCQVLLDDGLSDDGGIRVTMIGPRSETCVTGTVLGAVSWFRLADERRERLASYLLDARLPDGGWNCWRDRGARHSSFHTTINVLEGLREYVLAGGAEPDAAEDAQRCGREFLLRHRLFRSHRNGAVVDPRTTRLSFPPWWHYDVLRGLDHFAAGAAPIDERLVDAVQLIGSKRGADGRWPLQARHPGATWFEMERAGRPSRWNTLRALRVQRWWRDGGG